MQLRDRVKELRRVKASELLSHPKNWRWHPQAQRDALRIMLDRVGYVDAVIARETPGGLMLIDGHLRTGLTPDAEIPVLVVDLDESEADEVLATLDPLAAIRYYHHRRRAAGPCLLRNGDRTALRGHGDCPLGAVHGREGGGY